MAKMTKAEKLALEEIHRQSEEERRRVEYFPKLMNLLERACKLGKHIQVNSGNFVLYIDKTEFRLSTEYDPQVPWEESLDCFESEIAFVEEKERIALEKFQRTQAALAKLTPEERVLLGFSK